MQELPHLKRYTTRTEYWMDVNLALELLIRLDFTIVDVTFTDYKGGIKVEANTVAIIGFWADSKLTLEEVRSKIKELSEREEKLRNQHRVYQTLREGDEPHYGFSWLDEDNG